MPALTQLAYTRPVDNIDELAWIWKGPLGARLQGLELRVGHRQEIARWRGKLRKRRVSLPRLVVVIGDARLIFTHRERADFDHLRIELREPLRSARLDGLREQLRALADHHLALREGPELGPLLDRLVVV